MISPGGIGFDINCGMRLVRTDLCWPEVQPRLRELVDALAESARKRDLDRKIKEENAQKVKEMKLKQLAGTDASRYGFEI